MKSMNMLVCTLGLLAGFAGIARAADAPAEPSGYKQKMHDCATQMKTDHPDMNHAARRKACHQQLGASPKAHADAAAATTAAPAPSKP